MTSDLFARLKKLARKEGKIIFADDKDIFVILPLNEYEMLADNLYGEECGCEDEDCSCHSEHELEDNFDFGEEVFANNNEDEKKSDETDKDLIKRVNEDIAKWRAEQASQEINKTKNQEIKEEKVTEQKKEDVLTEEERYYLEPLE